MFSSVLIANRGEIAVRVARTAKRLGLRTIAVYSEADARALHVRVCDEAHPIGPAAALESYLNIDRIVDVARRAGAQCLHPGYGFLAENPALAEACDRAGIVFVGPPPEAIRSMGLKDRAKALMERAGVPVVPGYHGERHTPALLKRKAYEIGYPVLIKAVAGGGGKGMRRVDKHVEFDAALEGVQREAQAAFGNPRVLLEKYVECPRHIEVQVFADARGNFLHLNERDCSLQRRHQKVVEEAPAPGMTAEMREAVTRAAIEAARAVGYVGAGTVEFIADGRQGLRPDAFWFMEMNTRLQVEHPVTEAVTGLDLVEWQLRVAAGEALPIAQAGVALRGHAVEARVYAEDPERGFLPSTGKVAAFDPPRGEGIRVDAGVEAGDEVTPYYDPMIAKVIAWAETRSAALDRLAAALERTAIAGPRTNLAFLSALVRAPEVREGRADTGLIERDLPSFVTSGAIDRAAAGAGVARLIAREQERIARQLAANGSPLSPWDVLDGFDLAGPRTTAMTVAVDGARATAAVTFAAGGPMVAIDEVPALTGARVVDGEGATVYVLRHGRQTVVERIDLEAVDVDRLDAGGAVLAPMHGKVVAVLVEKGTAVRKGQRVAVIEAMKMEHTLTAPLDGVVAEVAVAAGSQVAERARVITIAPAERKPV